MGTTSNGKPWGHNTGRAASGIFYGWAVKRGVEAAQRREPQEGDSDWAGPVDVAKVGVLWTLFAGLCLIYGWTILNAVVMTTTGFFDPMRDGHLTKGLWSLLFAVPAVALSVLTIVAARALVARAEHLPPKRGERYLNWRLFPKSWLAMFFIPQFAYLPFYLVNK